MVVVQIVCLTVVLLRKSSSWQRENIPGMVPNDGSTNWFCFILNTAEGPVDNITPRKKLWTTCTGTEVSSRLAGGLKMYLSIKQQASTTLIKDSEIV